MTERNFSLRYKAIGIIFLVVGAVILIQMFRLQTSATAKALLKASERYAGVSKLVYPDRGNIYDRWGHLLAGDQQVYEVGINLQATNRDAETIASVLQAVLNVDYATVLEAAGMPYIEGKSEYIVITDFISADKVNALAELQERYASLPKIDGQSNPSLAGLEWNGHRVRNYPEGSLASNILGFYAFGERDYASGYFGIEEEYNDLLSGTPQQVFIPSNPHQMYDIPDMTPGTSLVLTIDRSIQASIENTLSRHIKKTKAKSATIVVEDPETGEILALASYPQMNLNEYWKYTEIYPNATSFNRAVSSVYEPGSVFKVLTMAAALDSGAVTPDTVFMDTGTFEVDGYTIYNWDSGAWGPQTMLGCLQHSLNVCLSWVASQTGADTFYDYLQAFGLGRPTGIDLAGEAYYPLRRPGDAQWFNVDLATNSFGQGIAVTPMQMIMAVSAIANDGKMMAPHIVRSMVDNGRQYDVTPQVVGTPIRAETAAVLTNLLATSLEEESSVALVPGYSLAGKTGTAEIATEYGYTTYLTNASFVGWGPTEDPKFVVYIWLEEPKNSVWGSVVAAPMFSEIVKNLVVLMNIPPDNVRMELANQ
ncbi:MAG: penicillin-binding protein 2 [Anaerolineaceae bacterium]|nr:penicillin-binding protein 2 [Anaerolineaceae bacterium]